MLLRFRSARRRRLLGSPLGETASALISENAAFLRRLTGPQREQVLAMGRVLAREKTFEGSRGFDVTDDMRLLIGVQAAWLLIGQPIDPLRSAIFPNVGTIIVYPGAYWNTSPQVQPGGVVTIGQPNLGEAHSGPAPSVTSGGPVLLSWPAVLQGGRSSNEVVIAADGGGSPGAFDLRRVRENSRNLVLHELAHKLDMLDGVVDGTPPLPEDCGCSADGRTRWRDVMTASYNQLRRDASRGAPTILDTYGAMNPAEFFAVSVESFFMQPVALRSAHGDLFELLACVFKYRP